MFGLEGLGRTFNGDEKALNVYVHMYAVQIILIAVYYEYDL